MTTLPIEHILPQLQSELEQQSRLIVQAPPGAGKSTLLPLHLLKSSWLKDGQVWLLEPRRLAAEQVARRLAQTLNEELGNTIGLMTGEFSKVSAHNKIVVMTEGILSQRLLNENDIPNCKVIVFDEYHERNVQTDLGLALAIQCQEYLREDLKLVLMSATLDSQLLANKLKANTITSEGRSFEVTVQYSPASRIQNRPASLSQQVSKAARSALSQHTGDILIFLPGVKEIRQCSELLESLQEQNIDVMPLHGQLTWDQQRSAMTASSSRKIILATDIAKTSITLENVTVVIDSGLERQAQYNVRQAMDELVTVKASQASLIQRAGRAGRVQAGICIRLFSKEDFLSRQEFSDKSITLCDSSQLALNLASWGSLDLNDYFLMDPPEAKRWSSSLELLEQLNIIHEKSITPHGITLSKMPLHPRFSHMIIKAKEMKLGATACYLAALLSEGDPLHFDTRDGNNSDLEIRLQLFELNTFPKSFEHGQVKFKVALRIKKLAHKLMKQLNIPTQTLDTGSAGILTMLAYPDRVAQKRGQGYRLRSGLGCSVLPLESLKSHDYLAIAHLSLNKNNQVNSSQTYIRLAANISLNDITKLYKDQFKKTSTLTQNSQNKLISLDQTCLNALVLDEKITPASAQQKKDYAWQSIKEKGLSALPLNEHHKLLLARLNLAHACFPNVYPSFDEEALIQDLENWLAPFMATCSLDKVDLKQALLTRLDWPIQQQLNQDFPLEYGLPTQRFAAIDYLQTPPVIRAKLQECFGILQSPTIAKGQVTLNLHLLSPAQRPLAMTQDLAFFWKEAYPQVRKENRGRYAKHPWPEDPLTAIATQKTKRRLQDSQ
jgi:ATP-dependent helicase HrpB